MAKETRKTRDGRYVLRPGEYERKTKAGFDYKYRDEFGKQHTIGALTLKELREKELAVIHDKADGISTARSRETLNDFYKLWVHQSRGLKANTLSNYQWLYETFVSQTIGKKRVKDITESDVIELYNELFDRGMTVSTIDGLQTVLHQVLQKAFKDGATRRNVSDGTMTKLKQAHPREKKPALTLAELNRFREIISDTAFYPVFETMAWTGLRVGEITGLTWDDIDEDAGVIHVRRTLVYYKSNDAGHMERSINSTKTPAAFRDMPLNDEIRAALQYQRDKLPTCKETVDGISGFIFATRFGGCQHQGTLNKAIRRFIKTANSEDNSVYLPYFSCHTLRRTYATNLCRAGVSVPVIMGLMGHTDYEITAKIYTDVQADMRQAGDAALRAWMAGQPVGATDAETAQLSEFRGMADMVTSLQQAVEGMSEPARGLLDAVGDKVTGRL